MTSKARAPKKMEFEQRLTKLLGSETECQELLRALTALRDKPERSFRLNALRPVDSGRLEKLISPAPLNALAGAPQTFSADLRTLAPFETHPLMGSGSLFLQEAGAFEIAEALGVQPGEKILDLCAAPGAKATYLGEKLRGEGWLVANDPVRARADKLDAVLARHGVLNVSVFALDPTQLAERFPYFFDRILVDAPSSAESLYPQRRDDRWDVRDVDVMGCARRQFLILHRAASMLKSGGRIVYATATYAREENEDLIQSFLKEFPEWKLLREQRRYPHKDGVAGGYWAVLESPAEWAEELAPSFDVLFHNPERGAIRHGPFRWDGELDLYAWAMRAVDPEPILAVFTQEMRAKIPTNLEAEPLDIRQARQYLRGESLTHASPDSASKAEKVATWEALPLGPLRKLQDRMNNLLPKILRGIS